MIKTTKEEIIKALDDIRCDWIVLNFKEMPNHFECKRCGKMAEAPQDCSFDQYFAQMRGFKMAHWDCVEMVETEDVVSEAVSKGVLQVEENVGARILYGEEKDGTGN